MAPEPQSSPTKKRQGAKVLGWIMMGMLIIGLGGFGVTNFGGGITAIGQVGERDIKLNDYARALRQEMSAFSAQIGQQIGIAQAQAFGIDQQVLQSVITRTALDAEADRIGISAGDAVVAAEVAGTQAFQGVAGTFDRETYRFALQQSNLSEGEFEAGIRADMARSLLQGAVVGGFAAPAALTDTLAAWAGEQRGFSVLRLTEADLPTPLPEATEADLTSFYTANIARFTRPEAKRITYVALLPDTIAKDMPVDETALKTVYESRLGEFMVPEKRLVERLAFGTDAEAAAAKARLEKGETFETLVAERKLTLDDIDLGDVAKPDLGAAGDAVFALAAPGIVGPFQSDIGPALFRMNAVLAAQETSFDEARPALATEMQTEAARLAISDRVEAIDDLLAGGATLEDIAREQSMALATVDYAEGADDNAAIAGYPAFRAAASTLALGDFPEAILLDDGGLIAMRLDETVPPTPIPMAGIQAVVAEAQRADALAKALGDRAIAIKSGVEAGATLASFGPVEITSQTDRQGTVEGLPAEVVAAAFGMAKADLQIIETAGFTGVLQLDSITPPDAAGEDAKAMRAAIDVQARQSIAQDAFTMFSNGLTDSAGISLDQNAINAVHAQIN